MAKIAINQHLYCFSLFQQICDEHDDAFQLDTNSYLYNQGFIAQFKYLHDNVDLYVIIHNRKEKHIDYNKKSCVFLNKKKTTIIGYERVVYKFLDNHGHKSCKKKTKFFSKSECLLVFKIDYYQKRQGYIPGIKYLTTDRWSEAWFNETDSVRYFDKVGQEVLDHCYARSVQTNISLDR